MMESQFLLDNPFEHAFFNGLNCVQMYKLLNSSREIEFKAGEYIIHEGETSSFIFVLLSGEVEILKNDPITKQNFHVAYLKQKQLIGEMEYASDKPRSASVIASTAVKALKIDTKEIKTNPEYNDIHILLISNLASDMSDRLRKTDESFLGSIDFVERIKVDAVDNGVLFVGVLFILSVITIMFDYIKNQTEFLIPTTMLATVRLTIVVLLAIAVIDIFRDQLKKLGLYPEKPLKNLIETVYLTAVASVLAIFAKWVMITYIAKFSGRHLFDFSSSWFRENFFINANTYVVMIIYAVFIPIYEFIVRCVFQGSMIAAFANYEKKGVWMSIITANMLGIVLCPTVRGFAGLYVFIMGLFLGWLFYKKKCLWCVSLAHLLLGVVMFFALNFLTMV